MSKTGKIIWEYETVEVDSDDPKYVTQKCRALQREGYEIISLASSESSGCFVILVRRMP